MRAMKLSRLLVVLCAAAAALTLAASPAAAQPSPDYPRYYWPIGDPADVQQQVNGAFMEFRSGPPIHFHDGIDVQGTDGTEVWSIDGDPNSTSDFDKMRVAAVNSGDPSDQSVRLTRLYDNRSFLYDHLRDVAVQVGDILDVTMFIAYTNDQNHVHFNDGAEGLEQNPFDPFYGIYPFSDTAAPQILDYRIEFDGTDFELPKDGPVYRVSGRVDILVRAKDVISGPGGNNVSIYGPLFAILDQSGNFLTGGDYLFSQWLPNNFVQFVYSLALSNNSTYWYQPSNSLTGNGFWDTTALPDGTYQLVIEVYDNRFNTARLTVPVEVANNPLGIDDGIAVSGPTAVNESQAVSFTGTFFDSDGTGTDAPGPWSWKLEATKGDGSLAVVASGTTSASQLPNTDWRTTWTLTTPVLPGTDWQVQDGKVAAVVSASVTDSDGSPHYDEMTIAINVPRLAGCTQPAADLRAWWPLNETSGTNSAELVAGIAGTRLGTPTPATGVVGGGLAFNSSDDYVQVPDAAALDFGTGDFSLEFWISTTDSFGLRVLQDKRNATFPFTGYHLFLQDGKVGLQLADTVSYSNWTSTAFVADGAWHHVAVAIDRDGLGRVYKDGLAAYTFDPRGRSGSLDNAAPFRLARRSSDTSSTFVGILDELSVYGRALTGAEAAAIYNAGSKGKCRCVQAPSGVTAWYPFDESAGTNADERVAGNDGQHLNGPTPVAGSRGNALRFDGVDDYVEAPDHVNLDLGTGDFSFDFWITTTQSTGVRAIQDKRLGSFPYTGYHVHLYNGNVALQLADTNGYTTWNSTAFVADGVPHFVAITVDRNGQGKVYKDGALAYTFNPTARQLSLDNGVPLRIAGHSHYGGGGIQATLDEFEVFKRVLTPNEIKGIHRLGKCK